MERMADGLTELAGRLPVIKEMQQEKEIAWINPDRTDYGKSMEGSELTMADVEDAEARLGGSPLLLCGVFRRRRKRTAWSNRR